MKTKRTASSPIAPTALDVAAPQRSERSWSFLPAIQAFVTLLLALSPGLGRAQVDVWLGWNVIPFPDLTANATDEAPGVASHLGRLYLFAKGDRTDQRVYFNTFDGAAWGSRAEVPGGLTTGAGLAAVSDGSWVYVFARSSTDGRVYVNAYNETTSAWRSTSGWQPLGTQTTDAGPAAAILGSQILVFVKGSGTDQGVHYFTGDTSAWPWPDNWQPLPGQLTDAALAAATNGGKLYVFAKGIGNSAVSVNSSLDGLNWGTWSALDGLTTTVAPAVASWAGSLCLFARAESPNQQFLRSVSLDGTVWSSWVDVPGAGGPALSAAEFNGDLHAFRLFIKPLDVHHIWENVNVGAHWSFEVVDVIPNELNSEQSQNAEASLAVWWPPGAPREKVIVSAFDPLTLPHQQPYFVSPDGGQSWAIRQRLDHGDTTLAWSPSGSAYIARLFNIIPDSENTGHGTIEVQQSADPTVNSSFAPLPGSQYTTPTRTLFPDQPRLEVVNRGDDRIYVGFNDISRLADFGGDGRTASINFSLDGGTTWNAAPGGPSQRPIVIEQVTPMGGQDSPAVEVAASRSDDAVYALFQRRKSATGGGDYQADVVLVRDDNGGLGGFSALGSGTLVNGTTIIVPWATALGQQNVGGDCSVAVNPSDSREVYVAYTEVVGVVPRVRVRYSNDRGASFGPVIFSPANPSGLAKVAVASSRTVGVLYTELAADGFLTTHLVQSLDGRFVLTDPFRSSDRVLARFLNGVPGGFPALTRRVPMYVGDYQGLKAVGNVFYGAFCAYNDPDPANFPNGVRFLRSFRDADNVLRKNAPLTSRGHLVYIMPSDFDPSRSFEYPNLPSFDPFYFRAEALGRLLSAPAPVARGSGAPSGLSVGWGEDRGSAAPLFTVETTPVLGPNAIWRPVTNAVLATNGQYLVTVDASAGSGFFRLRRQPGTNAQFTIYALAGEHGALTPAGSLAQVAGENLNFTATPDTNHAVNAWYLDGHIAQTGGSSFKLGNIEDDHTVTVQFAARNDLALTKYVLDSEAGDDPHMLVVGSNLTYIIQVANLGMDPATNVIITDPLPWSTTFVSAQSSQGYCTSLNGIIQCMLGDLAPRVSATVQLTVIPTVSGLLTNTAFVSAQAPDDEPSNNQASATVPVGAEPLLPAGSVWRYLDDGSDQGTFWRSPNFNDSSWKSGPAKLGYGNGDEGTLVNYGPDPTNRYITTYFRQTFQVGDPADYSSLLLSLRRDDGAIVYLNGQEVFRSNMATGSVNYLALAASQSSGVDDSAFITASVNSNLLVTGQNVLAAEVHLCSPAGLDMGFDLDLTGYLAPPRGPTILVPPQNQSVSVGSPVTLTVQASGSPPLTYQWFRDNAPIAGATLSSFSIGSAQAGDAGTYQVEVMNAVNSVFSPGALLKVNP